MLVLSRLLLAPLLGGAGLVVVTRAVRRSAVSTAVVPAMSASRLVGRHMVKRPVADVLPTRPRASSCNLASVAGGAPGLFWAGRTKRGDPGLASAGAARRGVGAGSKRRLELRLLVKLFLRLRAR